MDQKVRVMLNLVMVVMVFNIINNSILKHKYIHEYQSNIRSKFITYIENTMLNLYLISNYIIIILFIKLFKLRTVYYTIYRTTSAYFLWNNVW